MSDKGLKVFDTTIQETNIILKDIEEEFGWEGNRKKAYDLLRAVLQTLRDLLTVEEAVEASAQLPMLVRGIFFEGWKPSKTPRRMSRGELFVEVRKKFMNESDQSTENLVQGVLLALGRHISKGELEDIKSIIPKKLLAIFGEM